MKKMILFCIISGALLLFLLSSNSENTRLFSTGYYALLITTGILAAFLTGLLAVQFWKLRYKLKHKIFGAKLTLRLVILFTLVGVVPGIIVYAVSVQFLGKSIESWFDVRIEQALEGGLNLGRSSLNNSMDELSKENQLIAHQLQELPAHAFQQRLEQVIAEQTAEEAALFTAKGNLIAQVSSLPQVKPMIPDNELLQTALAEQHYANIENMSEQGLILRTLITFQSELDPQNTYILQLIKSVPEHIEQNIELVGNIHQDYQQLALSRSGLKQLYAITLTISLMIVLLTAISAAFFISQRIGSSLEALAEGTRAVAQGDFTGQHPIQSSDELGALTGLFNQMTRQLYDAKKIGEQQQREVESAKSHLESVLTHLSSGVLSIDNTMKLHSANTSASQILDVALSEMVHTSLYQIADRHALLQSFCQTITDAFRASPNGDWQRQIERINKNGAQILLIRGTRLPSGGEAEYVVVFDDISHLLQAERQAAWGEVARRLAHEIKNPLTPIQLSAERLEFKLGDKLQDNDRELLQRATQTIVNQVVAMKAMVSDFADYAKGPSANLEALDLHQLIKEVLGLYENQPVNIHTEFNARRCTIRGDGTRIRQVVHNLLQNAQDALHSTEQPRIDIKTQTKERDILLMVQDNGDGFSDKALRKAFEPYMTTKNKGTGLGLAIVKKIIEEHGGSIQIDNLPQHGAMIKIRLPLIKPREAQQLTS